MTASKKKAAKEAAPPVLVNIPHSWPVKRWPPTVFPGNQAAARHLVRCHKAELTKVGALHRNPGSRELYIMGAQFHRWLERPATERAVRDFRPSGINTKKEQRT